jgi:uncharacterized membrane protein YccC
MTISTLVAPAPAASRRAAFSILRNLMSTDPGLLRLLLATRGTLSVLMAVLLLTFTAWITGRPATDFAFGAVLSMIGPFVMRDATRKQRQMTLLLLLPPAVVAATVASLAAERPPMGEIWFLALVFVCALLQNWHPRAIGIGLVSVVMTYIGLYLRLPPQSLPVQLASLGLGVAAVWLVCFVLFPLRPLATLRRAVRSVERLAGDILHEVAEPGASGNWQPLLSRLNTAALAAEDQIELLEEPGRLDVRLHLFGLEQAIARLVALIATNDMPLRQSERLRLMGRRLRWGRTGRRNLRLGPATHPLEAALRALSHASVELQEAASRAAVASPSGAATVLPRRPGALRWRNATQVTLASFIAMLGGMAVSPQRWFWAVIAVYIVFLNTRTRGDAIQRGSGRLLGTLAGLFGGLAIAAMIAGNALASAAIMLVTVFCTYYFYAVSYTTAMFCVTILLGLLYGAIGAPLEPLLLLRLEETALGVGAAVLVASFVWPVPTRQQVRLSGEGVLRALADVIRATLTGAQPSLLLPNSHTANLQAIEAVRRLDRQIVDLRLALQPLTAGRFILRRAHVERPVTALVACAEAARGLVALSGNDIDDPAALQQAAARIEARIDGLIAGTSVWEANVEIAASPAGAALQQLNLALDLLSERLDDNLLEAFAV